jgi:hypothetical protein
MTDPYRSCFFWVLQLPLYGIILFGCYALLSIGWHLFTLSKPFMCINGKEDCDDAYLELKGQVEAARAGLAKKGFKLK